MRVVHLEQGGPEWNLWRSRGIGASDAPVILGLSPWQTRDQLLEKKVAQLLAKPSKGKRRTTPDNAAMRRGRELEPVARSLYTALTGVQSTPICIVADGREWLKASLDGWCETTGTIQEIKAVNIDDHETALRGHVPEKYFPQVQHQLFVGRPLARVAHYISYSTNQRLKPRERLAIVTVENDKDFQEQLVAVEELFWRLVLSRVPEPSWKTDN